MFREAYSILESIRLPAYLSRVFSGSHPCSVYAAGCSVRFAELQALQAVNFNPLHFINLAVLARVLALSWNPLMLISVGNSSDIGEMLTINSRRRIRLANANQNLGSLLLLSTSRARSTTFPARPTSPLTVCDCRALVAVGVPAQRTALSADVDEVPIRPRRRRSLIC